MTTMQMIAALKAEGYRITKPKPKIKDRVGPTFVAMFADGEITRMSTFTSLSSLDVARGLRIARAAYITRLKCEAPYSTPAILSARFEQDGQVLASYDW